MNTDSNEYLETSSSSSMVIPFSVDAIPPHKPYLRPRSELDLIRKLTKSKRKVTRGVQTEDFRIKNIFPKQNDKIPLIEKKEQPGVLLSLSELQIFRRIQRECSSSQSLPSTKVKKKHEVKVVESYCLTTKSELIAERVRKEIMGRNVKRNIECKTKQKVKYTMQDKLKLKNQHKNEETDQEYIADKVRPKVDCRMEIKVHPKPVNKNEGKVKQIVETKLLSKNQPIAAQKMEPRTYSKRETEKDFKVKLESKVQHKFKEKGKELVQNKQVCIATTYIEEGTKYNDADEEQKMKENLTQSPQNIDQVNYMLVKQLEEERTRQYFKIKKEVGKVNEKLKRIQERLLEKLRQKREERAVQMQIHGKKVQENIKENVKHDKEPIANENKKENVLMKIKYEEQQNVKLKPEHNLSKQKVVKEFQDEKKDKVTEKSKENEKGKIEKLMKYKVRLSKSEPKTYKTVKFVQKSEAKQHKVDPQENVSANKVAQKPKKYMEHDRKELIEKVPLIEECDNYTKELKKNIYYSKGNKSKQVEVLDKHNMQNNREPRKDMHLKSRRHLSVDTHKHEWVKKRKAEH